MKVNVTKDNGTYEKKIIENDTKNCTHGVVTINKGNMADYFKSKLNNKKLANYMTDNRAINFENERIGFMPKTENTLSTECRISEDSENNYAFDNPCLGLNSSVNFVPDTNGTFEKPGKKRNKEFGNVSLHFKEMDGHNKRKKLKTEISDSNYKNGFINPALNLDMESKENCNRNQFEVSRAEFGLENCGLDLTDENNDKKRVTFNDHIMLYEYDIDSFKKKKKGQATLDKFEVKNKKNKKRKRENITSVSDGFINKALDVEILCDEINDNELNEHQNKKNKKRKICKISSLETIEESPEQEKEIINIETETEVVISENEKTNMDQKSKKKKKKKIKDVEIIKLDIENEESNIKIEEIIKNEEVKKDKSKEIETIISKKCKKKKKKDEENYETELKYIVRTETDNDEQNSDMLEKPNMSHSVGIKNKNAIEIEISPVITFEAQEDIKGKKKKKKNIDKENHLRNENICDVEREISGKENVDKVQDPVMKKLMKKDKKHRKSKDVNMSDIGNSSCNIEITDRSIKRK